ncbi:MAG TPA: glycosyltransferase [Rhizomicrobium sp.]|nr:glycosyltransferase [Rhizomicrobium sp.]
MRLVFVCDPGFVNGGASKVAIFSARGLAERGVQVSFVCAMGPVSPLLSHPAIKVHCLDFESVWNDANPLAAAVKGIWNGQARRALEDILAPLPPEETIVHFHQWTKALSPSVLMAPGRYGLSSVVSLHDYFLGCPNGAYYRFPQGVPCSEKPMSASCIASRCDSRSHLHKMVRVLRQIGTDMAVRRAGRSLSVINVSSFAGNVTEAFISKEHKRHLVLYPVEMIRDEPVPVKDNSEFIFVGRLNSEKGVRQLAQAARRTGLPLTFVGDGPLIDEIRALGGNIKCTGWVDSKTVGAYMNRARALIFPSTWYETGGLVALDAIARGIPVIVSKVTAPSDLIEDGVNGYVIDPNDADRLDSCMQALADGARAERMGRAAYDRYWAKPQTAEAHITNLMTVYETILRERDSTPMARAS